MSWLDHANWLEKQAANYEGRDRAFADKLRVAARSAYRLADLTGQVAEQHTAEAA